MNGIPKELIFKVRWKMLIMNRAAPSSSFE